MNAKRNICWVGAFTLLMGVGLCNAALLAHFSFDENVNSVAGTFTGNGGLRDDAHIDHTVYKLGGGSLKLDGGYGAGETNGSAEVDGVYYSSAGSALDAGTGSYTVTFWINQIDRANPVRQTLIDGGGSDFQLFMNNNRWGLFVNDSVSTTAIGPWTPPPGTWKHIAMVLDQTANQIKWYEDGVLYSVETPLNANILDINGNNFNIGYQLATPNRGFNGYIDEVGIWNEALSASQINDVFVNGIIPVP